LIKGNVFSVDSAAHPKNKDLENHISPFVHARTYMYILTNF